MSTFSPLTQTLEPIIFEGPTASIEPAVAGSDWRRQLPTLKAQGLTLRELQLSDAASLMSMLTTAEVERFISPPPTSQQGFERFIQLVHRERRAGLQFSFGIVPDGCERAVGLVQVRAIAPRFSVGEWGFALGSPFWGTGIFLNSARMALDFAFTDAKVRRLEARAIVQNGRGNGALRKLGAVQEGILRGSLIKDGKPFDQMVWSIASQDWLHAKVVWSSVLH